MMMLFSILTNDKYLVIVVCLGKYFPTPKAIVVPETNKDHNVHGVAQGNNNL